MGNSQAVNSERGICHSRWLLVLTLLVCLATLYSGPGAAQGRGRGGGIGAGGGGAFAAAGGLPLLVPKQFDITGFIQEATLDTAGNLCKAADPRLAGGTLKVNNIEVIIPCNTILQMPAATLTWQEVFALAPRDIGLPVDGNGVPTQSGLAIADKVKLPVATPYNGPLPSYEARVQGNIIDGKYIAGLVFLSQQNLNFAQGLITAIDYENGELQIATKGVHAGLARVKINDPLGRYGLSHGAPGSGAAVIEPGYDLRFSIDEDSPTIHANTGFPMCIPRTDPFNTADDPDCPQANRPRAPNCASLPAPFPAFALPPAGRYCTNYVMPPASGAACAEAGCPPDPTRQAPFEIGDFIDFMGTLKVDSKGAYISAHTIVAHLAIYTTPGTMPAYLAIEMELQGTGALPVNNLPQEATSRIKVEGFSTDPSALVDIYAVDVDPRNGALSDRLLGAANPSGPPVIGRFRFIPFAGAFLPPTREFRVVSRTLCANPNQPCALAGNAATYANGLVAGQYHAPNFEFIFPENITLGDAVVPANLQDLVFLFCGSGPLWTPTGGGNPPLVGQLDPPPWDAPMFTPFFGNELCPTARRVGVPITPLAAAVIPAPVAAPPAPAPAPAVVTPPPVPVIVAPPPAPAVVPPAPAPVVVPPAPAAAVVPPSAAVLSAPPLVTASALLAVPTAALPAPVDPLLSAAVVLDAPAPAAAVTAPPGPAALAAPLAPTPAAAVSAPTAPPSAPVVSAEPPPANPPADAPPADAPPADALPPEVNAVALPDLVEANQPVTLSAAASDPNTPTRPLTYNWTQIGWPAVALTNADKETASFVAPAVTTTTELTFNIAVRNTLALTTVVALKVVVKPKAPPPSVSITAPASTLAGSRVALNGSVSAKASFVWTQSAGPVVTLNNPTTLTPDFIAPPGPANLSFVLTATNAAGTPASATRAIAVSADQLTLRSVSWDNRQGKGRLTLAAASSVISAAATAPPPGMTLSASFWNSSLPSSAAGSESHPISATMLLVRDVPGQEAVCASPLPCFLLTQNGAIVDPASPRERPTFLAPTTVVVKSSLGGKTAVSGTQILLR